MRQAVLDNIAFRFHRCDIIDQTGLFMHHIHQPNIVGLQGDHSKVNGCYRSHIFKVIEFEDVELAVVEIHDY